MQTNVYYNCTWLQLTPIRVNPVVIINISASFNRIVGCLATGEVSEAAGHQREPW